MGIEDNSGSYTRPEQAPRLFQYRIYIVLFPLSSNYRKQINQGSTQVNLFTLAPGLSLNEIKWYWWYS